MGGGHAARCGLHPWLHQGPTVVVRALVIWSEAELELNLYRSNLSSMLIASTRNRSRHHRSLSDNLGADGMILMVERILMSS